MMYYQLAATFLGLKAPTDCGGECFSEGSPIATGIGNIVGNIVGDLFVIAAFVAAIFVVYGGIKYIISMGSPDKMAGAKDTLTRALMGYFITLIANVIVHVVMGGTINNVKGGGEANLARLIGETLTLTGILGVVMTIVSGILYGISAGDPSKVTKAKNALITSLVGTAVAFLGTAIITFVRNNVNPTGGTDLASVAGGVVPALMWVAGVVSVVGLIVSGIMYATASGDEAKIVRAKNYIKFALVGLAVAVMAWALQTFVLGAVGG
jgi:hypothetical protein